MPLTSLYPAIDHADEPWASSEQYQLHVTIMARGFCGTFEFFNSIEVYCYSRLPSLFLCDGLGVVMSWLTVARLAYNSSC